MPQPSPPRGEIVPLAAIYHVIGAFFLFSCSDAAAKYVLQQGVTPPFASWIRFAVQGLFTALVFRIWLRPAGLVTGHPVLHLLRGALLVASGVLVFTSLQTLQLAELISIAFMAPLMITLLGRVMLREYVEWQRYAAVAGGFIGVLIIARPGMGTFQAGHFFAFGGMACYSAFSIMTRQLSTESAESLLLYPALFALVALAPPALMMGEVPTDPWLWAIMFGLGCTGALGHLLVIRAYRWAAASALAPYNYVQMLWSLSLGYLIFRDLPDLWTMAGSAVIIVSGLYLLQRDRAARIAAG